MPSKSHKQTERKKKPSTKQQTAPGPVESGDNSADITQAFVPESAQSNLLNDPRLQHKNAGDLRLRAINLLQQQGGNTQIQRMMRNNVAYGGASTIQREDSESFPVLSWLDRQRHNVMEATGLESSQEAERGRATAFYAHGTYGPQSVRGAQGRGGFDVTYDPVSGVERITIKGGVKFIDGLSVSGGTVTPQNSKLQGAANRATALTGADRAAFIAQYQWTPAQKAPFVTNLVNVVRDTWGSSATGLSFFINKPQWEWISAHVVIDTQLRALDESDTRAEDDHLLINAIKEPPGMSETGANVAYWDRAASARDPGSAFDQTMTIASSDVLPNTDNRLAVHNTVHFDHDSADLTDDQKQILNRWVARYQGAPGNVAANPTQVTIQGYTSASGSEDYNLNLGLRRTTAVRDHIVSQGFTNADSRVIEISHGEGGASATATPEEQQRERRVELIVDSGQAQVVAAHEFGHAFGLGDEYTTGSAPAGTRAGHDTLTRQMTDESGANLPGAIHENTDSIMSLGNVVRPQHYSTFHNALVQVTGESDWSIRS